MNVYKFENFTLIPTKRALVNNGNELRIAGKEFDVLSFLVENHERTCSHDEIIDAVWGGTAVENNSVEKAIAGIRKILGDDAKEPVFIKTVRGRGYLFIADLTETEESGRYELADDFTSTLVSPPMPLAGENRENNVGLLAVSAILLVGLSAWFLWIGGALWGDPSSHIIFADDFASGYIDENRWTALGQTVDVRNGVAVLDVLETDNWGRLLSSNFSVDPIKPLTIKCRLKVAYSRNLKDTSYFHGYLGLRPMEDVDGTPIEGPFFGVYYVNYDYESKLPDGNTDEQKAEGFFLVRNNAVPHRRIDYERGLVSRRIEPVWDDWFDQTIIYDPIGGTITYFINDKLAQTFNVGPLPTDASKLRLEINPEGWWLYHSIEVDSIEVSQ